MESCKASNKNLAGIRKEWKATEDKKHTLKKKRKYDELQMREIETPETCVCVCVCA